MKTDQAEAQGPDVDAEQRGRIVKRLTFAAGMVAVLLGMLAFFDYLSTPEEVEAPEFTAPVPVPAPVKPPMIQPVTPAEPEAPVETPAPPAEPVAPIEPPEPPKVAAEPAQPPVQSAPAPAATPAPVPAPAPGPRTVSKPVLAPVRTGAVPKTPVVEAEPEGTGAPVVEPPPAEPSVAPALAPAPPVPQPAPRPAPLTPRLTSGFVVQAGVFTSTQRAEELHARLTAAGIPSTLETRVQVGPFKNKAEAEAAKAKMKALGIDGVVLPPISR